MGTVIELTFHEVASIFPLMEGRDFEELKADIEAHGQLEPIWVHDGQVIDGRNRYRACQELGVEPETREWDAIESPILHIIHHNIAKKPYNTFQRACFSLEIEKYLHGCRQATATANRRRKAKIRNGTPKSERQPCSVCQKFRPIAQRHHLRPVAKSDPSDPRSIQFVWLCPNCHVIYHEFAKGYPAIKEFAEMLSPEQWGRMNQVWEVAHA